jgi:hypothetical protein
VLWPAAIAEFPLPVGGVPPLLPVLWCEWVCECGWGCSPVSRGLFAMRALAANELGRGRGKGGGGGGGGDRREPDEAAELLLWVLTPGCLDARVGTVACQFGTTC